MLKFVSVYHQVREVINSRLNLKSHFSNQKVNDFYGFLNDSTLKFLSRSWWKSNCQNRRLAVPSRRWGHVCDSAWRNQRPRKRINLPKFSIRHHSLIIYFKLPQLLFHLPHSHLVPYRANSCINDIHINFWIGEILKREDLRTLNWV